MLAFVLFATVLSLALKGSQIMFKILDQEKRDKIRKTYRLDFPDNVEAEQISKFLWAIGGTLRPKLGLVQLVEGVPSIAVETWGTSTGVEWRIKVPYSYEPFILPELEAQIPGIRITHDKKPPTKVWVHAEELGLKDSNRQLDMPDAEAMTRSILTKFKGIAEGQTLVLQWLLAPAPYEEKPVFGDSGQADLSWRSLLGVNQQSRDVVNDQRGKLDVKNMFAVARIGAVANTKTQAEHMVGAVHASLANPTGAAKLRKCKVPLNLVRERLNAAVTPMSWPMKLNINELSAVFGWPIGDPYDISGVPRGIGRRLPVPIYIPSDQLKIGKSNYGTRERVASVPFEHTNKHFHVIGRSGAGKSFLLGNLGKQIMEKGQGLVLFEAKGDLYDKMLKYVPRGRFDDVITLDMRDFSRPPGYNFLEYGDPDAVASGFATMFDRLFPENHSMWMHELMTHGIPTLMLDRKNTILDLIALAAPDEEDEAWRNDLLSRVRDPYIRQYWNRYERERKLKGNQRADPLLTRFHKLTKPAIRNIIGQSHSSFTMDEVVKGNKILLVNLAVADESAASIVGTLLLEGLWRAIQRNHSETGIHLFLDEFHRFLNIPVDMESIAVEARSMGLRMYLAHQQLTQISDKSLRQAVMTNVQNKIILTISADDARAMASEMGSLVSPDDIGKLQAQEMIARVMTDRGTSPPMTLNALPVEEGHSLDQQIRQMARMKYGRDLDTVQEEMFARRARMGKDNPGTTRTSPDPFADLGF